MELSQGQIIQKPNKQELSSLFMTHHLNVMHASVKFHKYIPYGLGLMARTRIGTDVRTGRTGGNTLCPSAILRIGGGIIKLTYFKFTKTPNSSLCKGV